MRITGFYELLGQIKYFIPFPLPPKDPDLQMDESITNVHGQAMLQLGKLEEMAKNIPDIKRFLKAYIIKEALLSSSIEGIYTTLLDVFTQPLLLTKPNKNIQLVTNYTKALDIALNMIKQQNLPITSRVLLSAHEALMSLGQGDQSNPGNYRKQAVKVGTLTPAPPFKIPELISDLEYFINQDKTPALIKSGLAHVQFEIIHPFLDGNGRIGRLLIVLILIESGLLSEAIIYPSYFFKKNQLEYYHKLDRVRTHGDFEGWLFFYFTAIRDSCTDAYNRAKDINSLENNLKEIILTDKKFLKTQESRLKALSIIFTYPIISISELSNQLNISFNTANQIIHDFIDLNILIEENNQKRNKLFKFKSYIDVLEMDYNNF